MLTVFGTLRCQRRLNVGHVSRGFLATHLLARCVLMRHEDASADPRTLRDGWMAQSVTLRWLTRNFRVPGDGFRSSWCTDSLAPVALRIH
jgi:hypothetical protein